ncbi:MAG TPA: hypothetical protein VFK47_22305, partial [Ktedonobacteraceae bacterium]|nr:hypothetical protein [Ktedonobacteraceae bacterium]
IEATGKITLVRDPNHPNIAVPDVVPDWDTDGELYRKLLDLIGQEVYVLVLPKEEMLALCKCGHNKGEHYKLQNWNKSNFGLTEPSMDQTEHVSWYSHGYCCPDKYCKCTKFQET